MISAENLKKRAWIMSFILSVAGLIPLTLTVTHLINYNASDYGFVISTGFTTFFFFLYAVGIFITLSTVANEAKRKPESAVLGLPISYEALELRARIGVRIVALIILFLFLTAAIEVKFKGIEKVADIACVLTVIVLTIFNFTAVYYYTLTVSSEKK